MGGGNLFLLDQKNYELNLWSFLMKGGKYQDVVFGTEFQNMTLVDKYIIKITENKKLYT